MIASEINTAGTEIAKTWLKTHGYFKIEITHVSDSEYIEADGKSRRMFLKLKVAEYPNIPTPLTDKEIEEIGINAVTVEREPWVAVIQIDEKKQLIGEIRWHNLGKRQIDANIK